MVAAVIRQRSLDDLGTPLSEVTFCVVDLETTGGSPSSSAITEIGALKVRRGEVVGSFHTLVDPGEPVPAFIRLLTGISDDMLLDAPPVRTVLPMFLEFLRDSVIVAHNARFDMSFIAAALRRYGYEQLPNVVVDTARLAAKVLAGEVANRKLATLARHFGCAHRPCHRAYADVLATTDVLHHLIERVSGYGVTTLEDLLSASFTRMDGTFAKIRLAEGLFSDIGVYRFLGAHGNTLYVGKSADVRTRVRSYFYGDHRRKIRDLLRETQSITAHPYPTTLEAEVAEARAIAAERPPYNRAGKREGSWYLKFALAAKVPKLSATRTPKEDGSAYVGPFSSMKHVRALIDTLRDAAPATVIRDPPAVLAALHARMLRLARRQRFEEAAELRDRAAALERTLTRLAEERALVEGGDVVLEVHDRALLVRRGRLVAAADVAGRSKSAALAALLAAAPPAAPASFVRPDEHRDARVICSWLRRDGHEARVLAVGGTWSVAAGARPGDRFRVRDSVPTDINTTEEVSMAGSDIRRRLDTAVDKRLLTHPFYRAWADGTLTVDDLGFYSTQYWRQVESFPTYLTALADRVEGTPAADVVRANLSDEIDGEHPGLWLDFAQAVGVGRAEVRSSAAEPETRACVDAFSAAARNASPCFALGMLYGYESQTPEVADTKVRGLRERYGIDGDGITYFLLHGELDVEHSAELAGAIGAVAHGEADVREAEDGARAGAEAIWDLLDGVARARAIC